MPFGLPMDEKLLIAFRMRRGGEPRNHACLKSPASTALAALVAFGLSVPRCIDFIYNETWKKMEWDPVWLAPAVRCDRV
jgi:hypothetical protein